MLADLGCCHALVGHSERRQFHYEDDRLIAAKARACLRASITPIVCIAKAGLRVTLARRKKFCGASWPACWIAAPGAARG